MIFETPPIEHLRATENALRLQIGRLFAKGEVTSADFRLHEVCRVWILDLPPEAESTRPILDFVRPGEFWHYQIKLRGQPRWYARSVRLRDENHEETHRFLELVESDIPIRFNRAIHLLDGLEQGGLFVEDDQLIVRLLAVPRYQFYGLALLREGNLSTVIDLDSFSAELESESDASGVEEPGERVTTAPANESVPIQPSVAPVIEPDRLLETLRRMPSFFGLDIRP